MVGASDAGLGFGLVMTLEDRFSAVSQNIQSSMGRLERSTDELANRVDRSLGSMRDTGSNAVRGLADNIESSMGRIYNGFGQIAAGVGILMPIKSVIDSFGESDSLERGMTVIMKSATAANAEIVKLLEVAKLPGLGLKEAISGSIQLQSVEMSADMARNALMGFGNAIATIGGGKVDLDGVVLQLRQMMSVGKVLGSDLKPIMSRIPQLGTIMKNTFGTASAEGINKLGISSKVFVEKITAELLKLPKVTGGIKNGLENLEDSFWKMKVSIGRALAPAVESLANSVGSLLSSIEAFAATPFGATVVKIAASFLTLVGSTLILRGLATAFTGIVGLVGGYGASLTKVFRLFSGASTGFMMILRGNVTGAIALLSRLGSALWAFATNPVFLVIGAVALTFYGLYEAYKKFSDYLEGKSGALTGFSGALQKIGGVLHGIGEIFSSVTDSGWAMSYELEQALSRLGVLDIVTAIGTYVVRLRAVWQGFFEAISEGFSAIEGIIEKVKQTLFNMLGSELYAKLSNLTTSLSVFKNIGYVIGWVFKVVIVTVSAVIAAVVVLGAFVVKVGAMIIHFGGFIISSLVSAFTYIYDFVAGLPQRLSGVWEWFKNMGSSAYEFGANFVTQLWEGIKSIWERLTGWIVEKWGNVKGMFSAVLERSREDIGMQPSGETSYGESDLQHLNQFTQNRTYLQTANASAFYTAKPTVINNTTQTVRDVHVNTHVDGRLISKSVNEASEMDDARTGF